MSDASKDVESVELKNIAPYQERDFLQLWVTCKKKSEFIKNFPPLCKDLIFHYSMRDDFQDKENPSSSDTIESLWEAVAKHLRRDIVLAVLAPYWEGDGTNLAAVAHKIELPYKMRWGLDVQDGLRELILTVGIGNEGVRREVSGGWWDHQALTNVTVDGKDCFAWVDIQSWVDKHWAV